MTLFKEFSIEDLHEFFYVWQMYADFGIRTEEAVAECAKATKKPAVKGVMEGLLKEMKNGASTADAMKKFPDFFPLYATEMVRVGERSGQMHKILDNLVFSLEHEMEMEKDIRSAMWMPKVFIVLLIVCFLILVFYVIPQMGAVLAELNIGLPLVTRLVLGFGQFMLSYWVFVVAFLIAFFIGWRYLMQVRPDIRDTIRLRMPILGEIRQAQLQFRFASILGMCMEANVQDKAALRYAADASDSFFMRGTLMATIRRMEASGESLLDALRASNIHNSIPDRFFLLIRAGSKGNLGQVLLKLATQRQQEILRLSKQIGDKLAFSVIMPAALILVFLVLSVELPTWEVMSNTNLTNISGGM